MWRNIARSRVWRAIAVGAFVAGYIAVSWLAMTWWPDRPWAVALLFGPLLAGLAIAGAARRSVPTVAGAVALAALLVFIMRSGGIGVQPLYVAQHAAIHALIGWSFAVTLRPGAKPLITMMGERVHEHFSEAQRDYTRRLTRLWALYFPAMIALSLVIYLTMPWAAWSFFCNILTPLFAVLFFVGEHVVRYRLHPEFERIRLETALRAWRTASPRS
jgi:uncharacterized membrane protein